MDYQNIYDRLMSKAKNANRVKNGEVYYELHHIKPFFLNNTATRKKRPIKGVEIENLNHPDNVVLLTFKEHVFAHVLLCKIYENTKYELGAVGSVNIMLSNKDKHIRKSEYLKNLHVAERVKSLNSKKLSLLRKNTICVKEAKTGNMIGFVRTDDERYLSGEYVFYQKGIKKSDAYKRKLIRHEHNNSNYSGHSDLDIEKSFLKCSEDLGFIPSKNIWFMWAEKNKEPYLKHIKGFRFGGAGFEHLYELAEKQLNMKYDPYFTRNSKNKNFVKENKYKWEN